MCCLLALAFFAPACGGTDPVEPDAATLMDAAPGRDAPSVDNDVPLAPEDTALPRDASPPPDAFQPDAFTPRPDTNPGCTSNRDCDDSNPCTEDRCFAPMCVNPVMDGDADGYAPTALGACGRDCNDFSGAVTPDQMLFFTSPISGAPAAVDFDYNCDGREESRDVTRGACTPAGPGTCTLTSGWALATPPACGVPAGWIVRCTRSGATCTQAIELRSQACR